MSTLKIKFWGVRGSIPCPGALTTTYGGNTACIELRLTDPDRLIILDAGSGIRELGNAMMATYSPSTPINTEIFLTHTHWDHIMGFPFFTPVYVPGTRLKVHGPVSCGDAPPLEAIVGGQLTYQFFPIRETELAADITYEELKEGRYDLGDGVRLKVQYLNHPLLCLGYRFEYKGKVVCTAYDTEPFMNLFSTDPHDPSYDENMALEGEIAARQENSRLQAFYQDADLLIYDAQYTEKEYNKDKIGWGHSAMEYAIAAGKQSGVARLALFHHDPMRTDGELDALGAEFRQKNDSDMNLFFAKEGMEIYL